ncbi:MAG: SUMF1/EgtB/PvdO family nonheme iron enzyme [Pseudomonadota bacterium]
MIGAGDPKVAGKCPDGMVFIETARFAMGSENGDSDERPVRGVEVSAFCIDRHGVTNAEYSAFEAAKGGQDKYRLVQVCAPRTVVATGNDPKKLLAKPDSQSKLCKPVIEPNEVSTAREKKAGFDGPQQPVVFVDWRMAEDYCVSKGGHLPTEAQRERAAKGPSKGYKPGEYATASGTLNHKEAQYNAAATADVCTHGANGYGLCDMSGNVWEWVQDTYSTDAYNTLPAKDPVNLSKGNTKVVRGGSWCFSDSRASHFLRAANRFVDYPVYRLNFIGFRCVVPPQDSKK